jgi:UDP-N-acetylmuramate--alanine ligase
MNITLDSTQHVYCIGIGGIGLSALARMFLLRGTKVSGSDLSPSRVTDELQRLGANIFFGQEISHIPKSTDLVLYTIAIPDTNPELVDARKRNLALMTYPEALGLLSRSYRTIAISGTHGKTTTTAMTAEALIHSGLSPTVVVGSFLKDRESNFVAGTGKEFVVEACEYRDSFSHLHPWTLAITNIDADHLDYYRDIDDIIAAFGRIARRVPEDGFIVADPKDSAVAKALEGARARIIDYTQAVDEIELSVPGEHNRKNAAVGLSIARILEADERRVKKSLKEFKGTWRRFEKKGSAKNGALVYDDYAHHPSEIRATLSAAREKYPDKRILAVFQPHLFSRTAKLLDEFAQSFSEADEVLLLPIYKAREIDDGTISSEILAEKARAYHKNARYVATPEDAIIRMDDFVSRSQKDSALVITLGAGDVHKVGELFLCHAQ